MSKICPITDSKILYLDCIECEEKICKKAIIENISKTNKKIKKIIQRKDK